MSSLKPTILIVAGHSGCGKTTVSKHLIKNHLKEFLFLDKDTLYLGLSGEMMQVVTGNRNDRDSPKYGNHCRDHEYDGLLNCAIENAQLGRSTLICAPFGREFKEKENFDKMRDKIGEDALIKAVWLYTHENVVKLNIEKRANPYDDYKLNNWQEYAKRRQEPNKEIYSEVLFIENNLSSIEDMSTQIEQYVRR